MGKLIHMKLKCDPALFPGTASYVKEIAETCGVAKNKVRMLCFALESILDLRMRDSSGSADVLDLEVRADSGEFAVSVTDKGLPYLLTDNQKKILERGLVDRFTFEQLDKEGQRITIFFQMEYEYDGILDQMVEEVLLDDNISCRIVTTSQDDMLRTLQCIYSVYSFNYVHSMLYHTDVFRELLESGKFFSMIATNDQNQTLGHVALEEHDWLPGMMEICTLLVKPCAQGHGISKKLVHAMSEVFEELERDTMYCLPSIFHPITQKLFNRGGFTPCGLYINMLGPEHAPEYSKGTGRLSASFCVSMRNKTDVHRMCVPDECRDFIQAIFSKEGVAVSEIQPATEPDGKTSVSYKFEAAANYCEIKIDRVGSDYIRRIDETIRSNEMAEVILMFLNMNDPSCAECYNYLRGRGLMFSGILPGGAKGDYVLLQDLRDNPIEWEKIVTEPGYKELIDEFRRINGI